MKKLISSLFIIYLLFISGCFFNEKSTTYSITFYIDGIVENYELTSYEEGKQILLPVVENKENYYFSGWFDNINYTGDIITEISAHDTGNKIFYGKYIEVIDYKNILNNALAINNYSYKIVDTYNIYYNYQKDNNILLYQLPDDSINYKILENDKYKIVYYEYNTWYYTLDKDKTFKQLDEKMYDLNLNYLTTLDFKYDLNNNLYILEKKENIDFSEFSKLFNLLELKTCKIYLNQNQLCKIYLKFINDIEYTINFSNINNTHIDVPEAKYNFEANMNLTPLEEVSRLYSVTKGLPSIGEPKVLIIPVEFTDYPAPESMKEDLEVAFFGTSAQTGWESLQSYYYKSSYGKLRITGTVLEPFNTGKKSTYYKYNSYADYDILKSALEYYDPFINYDDYDYDKDGYIDSIYLIYTKPYEYSSDLWWAYTYEYFTEDYEYYDGVEADYYVFMSYQFLFDKLQGKDVKYNSETIIHETGHLFGLDDYYDYEQNNGPEGGIGGGDMMDYNIGDHNAYSKIILGWITPTIITDESVTINLQSFEKTGECILVCNDWGGTYFSEYYLIDFYTPTGLNEYGKGRDGLFSISGIRIFHIDARLKQINEVEDIWTVTKNNNTSSKYRLISLIEADNNGDIDNLEKSSNSDLFLENTSFINPLWNDGSNANFEIFIHSINEQYATILISI